MIFSTTFICINNTLPAYFNVCFAQPNNTKTHKASDENQRV